MNAMIERVARAICASEGNDPNRLEPGNSVGQWEGVDGVLRNGDVAHFFWRERADVARSAIEAMREPTIEMEDAGNSPTYIWVDETSSDIWSRMIDAALKEES